MRRLVQALALLATVGALGGCYYDPNYAYPGYPGYAAYPAYGYPAPAYGSVAIGFGGGGGWDHDRWGRHWHRW